MLVVHGSCCAVIFVGILHGYPQLHDLHVVHPGGYTTWIHWDTPHVQSAVLIRSETDRSHIHPRQVHPIDRFVLQWSYNKAVPPLWLHQ